MASYSSLSRARFSASVTTIQCQLLGVAPGGRLHRQPQALEDHLALHRPFEVEALAYGARGGEEVVGDGGVHGVVGHARQSRRLRIGAPPPDPGRTESGPAPRRRRHAACAMSLGVDVRSEGHDAGGRRRRRGPRPPRRRARARSTTTTSAPAARVGSRANSTPLDRAADPRPVHQVAVIATILMRLLLDPMRPARAARTRSTAIPMYRRQRRGAEHADLGVVGHRYPGTRGR